MLNKVMLIGNLGADVELRYMPNGNPVTTISVATSKRWKDKKSGEKKEHTEWHKVCLFNHSAEFTGKFLKKGSKVYIEGELRTQKWADAQGVDHFTTEIVARVINSLDPMPQGADRTHPASKQQASAYGQNTRSAPQHEAPPTNAYQGSASSYDDYDDDIPFN